MIRTRKRRSTAPAVAAAMPAKIISPFLPGVYPRTRLFELLNTARGRPIVWLSAPAGFGKTTLAASYLKAADLPHLWYQIDRNDSDAASFFYYMRTAASLSALGPRKLLPLLTSEYLRNIHRFTDNYFHDLFARLPRPGVIIFDDFQDLDEAAVTQELLQRGLQLIPAGINVIVLSRAAPPGTMARLIASDRIALVSADDLKLTEEESHGIMQLHPKRARLSEHTARRLHQKTQGWVAGLVLISEHTADDSENYAHSTGITNQLVFDYFANEIFSRASSAVQTFLLRTAFVPTVSVAVAKRITAEISSEAILSGLVRRNFFTTQRAGGSNDYQYHPLFREFLTHRAANVYTEEQLRELKRLSAISLVEVNDFEAAIALLLSAEDWPGALLIILGQASTLVAQGRTQTLGTWLNSLPASCRDESPWALYWLGMCRLSFSPAEARQLFIQAFAIFEKETDAAPVYLTWSGIIESFVLEYDDFSAMREWLDLYPSLANNRSSPTAQIENASVFTYLVGLIFSNYDDPNLPIYAARAEQILAAEKNGDRKLEQGVSLGVYYFLQGHLGKLDRLVQTLAPHAHAQNCRPLGRLQWYTWKTRLSSTTGETAEARAALHEGLELADQTGVHALDVLLLGWGIWGQLCAGDVGSAHSNLQRLATMTGCGQLRDSTYSYYAGLVHLHRDDISPAHEEALYTLQRARCTGLPYTIGTSLLLLASVNIRQGALSQALEHIAEARVVSRCANNSLLLVVAYCAFSEANIYRIRGDYQRSLQALSEALQLAGEMGTVIPAFLLREEAAMLCAMALDANIAPGYVSDIIKKTDLIPPNKYPCARWPRPVRIYTLGQFAVVKDGVPLTFSGGTRKKPSEKPRELLRVLISLGAREVNVRQLAQILWPDADGDMARIAFKTTLYRLRKLLGEKHLVLQDGLLSLDNASCWLDSWALEDACEMTNENLPATARIQTLLELYRGPFLLDDDAPSALLKRKTLSSKFLRAVVHFGKLLEAQADWHTAISLYQRAIDVAPLTEDFYSRLMHCYCRVQRPAEALDVYHGCSTTLRSVLQIEPTAGLKSLYTEIRRELA